MKKLGALILGAILTIGIGAGISVNPKTDVAHAASTKTVYELVADASTLAANDVVIITSADAKKAMSTTQNKNNRGVKDITKSGNYISDVTDVQLLTLQAGNKTGTFALNTGSGYLCAASSSNNYLRTETTLSDNSSWTITIAEDVATIKAQGSYTRNWLRYNSSNDIFSCYGSGQQDISLYRQTTIEIKEGAVTSITLNSTKENILVGESYTLTATVNEDAENKTVAWSSSDPTIATVNNGVVSTLKTGYVEITATSSNAEIFATCSIAVTENAGTESDPLNVLDAAILGNNGFLSDYYYIEGTVKEIKITDTATGYITDGINDFYFYKIYDFGNNVKFSDTSKVKENDEVVIYSKLGNYEGDPQAQYGWFTSVVSSVTLTSIAISGDIPAEHYVNEEWNLAGLVVTATYSDELTYDVTESATITVNPETPTATGEQKITITAEYNGKTTSKEYTVTVLAAVSVVVDTMNGNSFEATSTSYKNFSGVKFTSNAVYAGNNACATDKDNAIQLRTNNSNSGIISTTSGGRRIHSIEIVFNSSVSDRYIDVFASNTPYTGEDASALYSADTQGTLVGTITTDSTKLNINGNYKYFGIRSHKDAIYLDEVKVSWEVYTAATVAEDIRTLAGGWDNDEATDNCATNYAKAKEMILSLSAKELKIFQESNNDEITNAKKTYEHWCKVNGDSSPYAGAIVDASNVALIINNNNMVTIIVILGAVLALAATALLISKKRKLAK